MHDPCMRYRSNAYYYQFELVISGCSYIDGMEKIDDTPFSKINENIAS